MSTTNIDSGDNFGDANATEQQELQGQELQLPAQLPESVPEQLSAQDVQDDLSDDEQKYIESLNRLEDSLCELQSISDRLRGAQHDQERVHYITRYIAALTTYLSDVNGAIIFRHNVFGHNQ